MIPISILDQSPVREGGTPAEALAETLELARRAGQWGYHRYWVAEHHAMEGLAGCAPEVLLARMGAETGSMRIGSGGVMLPHYSPYKVAETFKVLATLYPGRIDLGIGQSPRIRRYVTEALAYGARGRRFEQMVEDLLAWLRDAEPAAPRMRRAVALPRVDASPEPWLLGTSADSARLAARLGIPYCHGLFINPEIPSGLFGDYRREFRPGSPGDGPRSMLCVFVICAGSEEEARRLASSRDLWYLRRVESRSLQPRVPDVEEAAAFTCSEEQRTLLAKGQGANVIGDPGQVASRLHALVREHGCDELMIVTITWSFEARCRSYELLARAWKDLAP